MEEELWKSYQASRLVFKKLTGSTSLPSFIGTDDYFVVRKYLNIHELMSVGIHEDVLDDHVCYNYWADQLIRDYESARELIALIRTLPDEGTEHTYSDVERTCKRWKRTRESSHRLGWL